MNDKRVIELDYIYLDHERIGGVAETHNKGHYNTNIVSTLKLSAAAFFIYNSAKYGQNYKGWGEEYLLARQPLLEKYVAVNKRQDGSESAERRSNRDSGKLWCQRHKNVASDMQNKNREEEFYIFPAEGGKQSPEQSNKDECQVIPHNAN